MLGKKKPSKQKAGKAKGKTDNYTAKVIKTYRKTEYATDAYLMDWTSTNLPSNKDYFITDVDLVIRDVRGNTENLMLIEVKRRKAKAKLHQQSTLSILHRAITYGLKAKGNTIICQNGITHKLNFCGCHVLTMEGTTFENGRIYWDNIEITEEQLIKLLSFE